MAAFPPYHTFPPELTAALRLGAPAEIHRAGRRGARLEVALAGTILARVRQAPGGRFECQSLGVTPSAWLPVEYPCRDVAQVAGAIVALAWEENIEARAYALMRVAWDLPIRWAVAT